MRKEIDMIDLNTLEKEIDELLAKETNESLSKWLFEKRNKNINAILGSGAFISVSSIISYNFTTNNIENTGVFENKEEDIFAMTNQSTTPMAA
ncbi:MAG: hypothetical protein H6586_00165 [Flavobacteriales bacterium]|nr:hypothetical protein [Flavobacteriales bacterium]